MDETNIGIATTSTKTDHEDSIPRTRDIFEKATLLEPYVYSTNYVINLERAQNPIFYAKARETYEAVPRGASVEQVVETIGEHLPLLTEDKHAEIREEATTVGAITMDAFFQGENANPHCLERSVFSQLIFALHGIETRLTAIGATDKNGEPFSHAVLTMKGPNGEQLVVESTQETSKNPGKSRPVSIFTMEEYQRLLSVNYRDIEFTEYQQPFNFFPGSQP